MADLVPVAAAVAPGTGAILDKTRLAGEAISIGKLVYLNSSDNKYYLADANGSSSSAAAGIAVSGASAAGQPIIVQTAGIINPGCTSGVGTIYISSATPGGIALGAPGTTDLVSTMYPWIVGVGITASTIKLILRGGTAPMP